MRNTPLWRPQPDIDTETGETAVDSSTGIQRVSAVALAGLGLTLALGVGAVSYLTYFNGEPSPPASVQAAANEPKPAPAPAAPPVVSAEPRVAATGARLPDTRPVPPVQVIDVAVAQTEADVAKLEEITGMVEPAPPVQPNQRATTVINPTSAPNPAASAASELRPAVDASAVVVQPNAEADNTEQAASDPALDADEATQTASIQPDSVPAERPAEELAATADAGPAQPPLSPVKVNRYVNMRSGPADEARVVIVIPAGATVQAQQNCGWCAVTYNGQRGYIYKSFLQRGGATASAEKPATNQQPRKRVAAPSAKPGLY